MIWGMIIGVVSFQRIGHAESLHCEYGLFFDQWNHYSRALWYGANLFKEKINVIWLVNAFNLKHWLKMGLTMKKKKTILTKTLNSFFSL